MSMTPTKFWAKVNKTETCWVWLGGRNRAGYGVFQERKNGNRVHWLAHRFALFISGFELDPSLVCDHTCRNRLCVFPTHLRQVSQRTNSLENSVSPPAVFAARDTCSKGHEYDKTYFDSKGRRRRACSICSNSLKFQSRVRRRRRLGIATTEKPLPHHRTKTHCPAGHAYSVHGRSYFVLGKFRHRKCKACDRERKKAKQ